MEIFGEDDWIRFLADQVLENRLTFEYRVNSIFLVMRE